MNRALLNFLLFCLVLLIAGVGAALWFGLGMVRIAFDEEQRQQPMMVLQLSRHKRSVNHAGHDNQIDISEAFRAPMASLMNAEGGVYRWRASLDYAAQGSVENEWEYADLVFFPEAAGYVKVATGSAYRELVNAYPEVAKMTLASQRIPSRPWPSGVIVLIAYQASATDGGSRMEVLLPGLASSSGELVWDTGVTPLGSESFWNRLMAIHFADRGHAEAWLYDPDTEVERSILAAHNPHMTTLVFRAGKVN
ncbi:MAG: hypothetical protein O3A63_01800 [Proteobacteria bacterium]|nr:hypothetical protein [Pseudomonadota bacterium]